MKTVLVIFGGRSTEHDVSIISALTSVIKPLELTKKYSVEAIYIAKNGNWFWDDKLKDVSVYRDGTIETLISSSSPVSLQFNNGINLVKNVRFGKNISKKIDIVFPVMHGSFGEDGALMGLLEMGGVPYVGCNVPSSALAMDKALSKQIAESKGIPTTKWVGFMSHQLQNDPESIIKMIKPLTFPLFVKPVHAGSSIGITRVSEQDELMNALEVAAHYDDKILVEEGVSNLIEVTLPIIGNTEPVPAYLEKPLTNPEDFFDFETKYMQGGKKGKQSSKQGAHGYSQIPAELPEDLYQKAEKVGLDVYKALGCSGLARVDMLIDSKTGTVYFNEVNPMPGGLYAHNWRQKGISGTELVEKLINYAEERHESKEKINTSFATNYLKQF